MRSRLRGAMVAVVVLTAVAGAACGDDEAAEQTAGPYAVGTRRLALVDDTRPTPSFEDTPEADRRTVDTDIWYPAAGDASAPPAADADPAEGPFPLIVFNHGQQGEPQQYPVSMEGWARAGYVVAAPRHPLSIKGGPGAPFLADSVGEVGDISFVIDQVGEELGDLVDLDDIAVAGHSSGASAAYAAAFNSCCRDDRIDAVLLEALVRIPFEGGDYDVSGTPVMYLHGDKDAYPIAGVHEEYEGAGTPKFFVTIAGGDHSNAYRTGKPAELVTRAALDFFDYTLKGRDSALDDLGEVPGVEADPG